MNAFKSNIYKYLGLISGLVKESGAYTLREGL